MFLGEAGRLTAITKAAAAAAAAEYHRASEMRYFGFSTETLSDDNRTGERRTGWVLLWRHSLAFVLDNQIHIPIILPVSVVKKKREKERDKAGRARRKGARALATARAARAIQR